MLLLQYGAQLLGNQVDRLGCLKARDVLERKTDGPFCPQESNPATLVKSQHYSFTNSTYLFDVFELDDEVGSAAEQVLDVLRGAETEQSTLAHDANASAQRLALFHAVRCQKQGGAVSTNTRQHVPNQTTRLKQHLNQTDTNKTPSETTYILEV